MVSKKMTVTNKIGFHALPISLLLQVANKYGSRVILSKGKEHVDLNSIVSLLKLRVKCGDSIELKAEGPDEEMVIRELSDLIESKFGEE